MTYKERLRAISGERLKRLAGDLADRGFRHSYAATHTRHFLARQFRAFRGERNQTEFGEQLGVTQSVISRYENPDYGKQTLQTLFDTAEKLDVAVFLRLVDWPTFLELSADMSDDAAYPSSFDETLLNAMAPVDEEQDSTALKAFDAVFAQRSEHTALGTAPMNGLLAANENQDLTSTTAQHLELQQEPGSKHPWSL